MARFIAVLFLVSTVACGGSSGTAAPPTPSATFTMVAMNGSGVTGVGQIYRGAGSFKVSIQLKGMLPRSSHVSHVHIGTCANPGGVAYALLQVVADASGNATATTTVGEYFSMPAKGWYVNVHKGEDMNEVEYVPSISCGDVPAS